jgi:GNAT superfamily N-acetyltransferase
MEHTYEPLTMSRWPDFVRLFGENGACGGCWCMYWRRAASEFEAMKYDGNRKGMKQLVSLGEVPGLIGYVHEIPAGWVAIAPRESTPRLENSRVAARVDDLPVWSITCLYISRDYRRQGFSTELIKAASHYAFHRGALAVEAYPHDLDQGETRPGAFVWTGLSASFQKAGFKEVARRSRTRPVMRLFKSG